MLELQFLFFALAISELKQKKGEKRKSAPIDENYMFRWNELNFEK